MLRKPVNRQRLWQGLLSMLLTCSAAVYGGNETTVITPPVIVMFGTHSLAPDTPVNDHASFIYKSVRLPLAHCDRCEHTEARREVKWKISGLSYLPELSQPERGWYVMQSGLKGIGIGIEVKPDEPSGEQKNKEILVGLVRLEVETGAGLVALPPAEFGRQTFFYDKSGKMLHIQEDNIRVSADLRVPTCTSSSGNLTFKLPDIDQAYMRRSVKPGQYTETKASQEQVIVADCSSNTQNLQVRFIPLGEVSGSVLGPETILYGSDVASGKESGAGFLMKFNLTGYGQSREGVIRWNKDFPVMIKNALPTPGDGSLNRGIRLMLRAYYARPEKGGEIVAGQTAAKGIYQVSYE